MATSTMGWIRSNMLLVVIVIAVAIVAFILGDFSRTDTGGGGTQITDVGEIGGESVSLDEWSKARRKFSKNQQGSGDQALQQTSQQAWQQITQERIYAREYGSNGMNISKEEMAAHFFSKKLHPQVERYFQPLKQNPNFATDFGGNLGQAILAYFDNADTENPNVPEADRIRFKEGLLDFEDYMRHYRTFERLQNAVQGAYVGSSTTARRAHRDENRKVSGQFLSVPYSSIADSTLGEPSDGDYQSWFNKNKEKYVQEASTAIRYMKFDVNPSSEDSARAKKNAINMIAAFKEASNDSVFSIARSSRTFDNTPKWINELPFPIRDAIVNAAPKTVLGPYIETAPAAQGAPPAGSVYSLYKLLGTETADEYKYKLRYFSVAPKGATKADTTEAKNKAAALRADARRDFTKVMGENNGREMGWYSAGSFGDDFDDALKGSAVNALVGPIKTRQGYVVAEVMDRTNTQYIVAQVEENIYASEKTNKKVYQTANNFAAKAQDLQDIEKATNELGLGASQTAPNLTATSFSLPGVLDGGRRVIAWALRANNGDFSDEIMSVNGNAYLYAQVIDKKAKGYQSLDVLKPQLRQQVMNELKAKTILSKLKAAAASGDLNAVATSYGAGAVVNAFKDLNFKSNSADGIGNEALVIGRVCGMEQGATSDVIQGNTGVFIIQATTITEAPEADEATLAGLKATDVTTKKTGLFNSVSQAMNEAAGVVDNRYKLQ